MHYAFHRRSTVKLAIAASIAALVHMPALAQSAGWPDRPIKLVVTYPPGGVDVGARVLAEKMSQTLGQAIVVENRPGAAGAIGAKQVAQSPADGYTMMIASFGNLVSNRLVPNEIDYDPVKDFRLVGLFARGSYVLAVPSGSHLRSVQQLVDELKAKPDSLTYGTASAGSPQELAALLFQQRTGTQMRAIPYKGGSSAMSDLVAGTIDMVFDTEPSVLPLVKSGRLRALGVTSAQRSPSLPDVPTLSSFASVGLAGYDFTSWAGFAFPAGTSDAIVKRASEALAAAMAQPDVQSRLRTAGFDPATAGSQQTTELLRDDLAKWKAVMNRAQCGTTAGKC